MVKTKKVAQCTECGHRQARWEGRCPGCGEWGSLVESEPEPPHPNGSRTIKPAAPITHVPTDEARRAPTGIGEFDRVLGGGLVAGSVVLLGGEPGAGKSTLLLQVARALATGAGPVLYVSAEESPSQVRLRADRLAALHPHVLLASETDLGTVLGLVEHHDPAVMVLDSIQTVRHPDVPGAPGQPSQVRECASAVVAAAKQRGMAVFLVGHVTKDGQLAGPRMLEHLVDVVCEMDGDRHHALRLVRAVKNRFGPVGEVGCFEMTGEGLRPVADAGRLFVGAAPDGTTGVVVTLALEGRRPVACEVQALVVDSPLGNPRRVASGLDSARLSLLVAVCQQRGGVALANRDVFASTVGGIRLIEPAADLAVCLAIASSRTEQPVPRDLVVLGEVGLAGELRPVAQVERRLSEAARLGFRQALVPAAYDGPAAGLELRRGRDLADAMGVALGSGMATAAG
ncbi:MAG: DNA repair protein RadA [Egibacteraceae bacterium]